MTLACDSRPGELCTGGGLAAESHACKVEDAKQKAEQRFQDALRVGGNPTPAELTAASNEA